MNNKTQKFFHFGITTGIVLSLILTLLSSPTKAYVSHNFVLVLGSYGLEKFEISNSPSEGTLTVTAVSIEPFILEIDCREFNSEKVGNGSYEISISLDEINTVKLKDSTDDVKIEVNSAEEFTVLVRDETRILKAIVHGGALFLSLLFLFLV